MQIRSSFGQNLGTFCGEWTGKTIVSLGEYAQITFQSDSMFQERGFLMHFWTGLIGKTKGKISIHMRKLILECVTANFCVKPNFFNTKTK